MLLIPSFTVAKVPHVQVWIMENVCTLYFCAASNSGNFNIYTTIGLTIVLHMLVSLFVFCHLGGSLYSVQYMSNKWKSWYFSNYLRIILVIFRIWTSYAEPHALTLKFLILCTKIGEVIITSPTLGDEGYLQYLTCLIDTQSKVCGGLFSLIFRGFTLLCIHSHRSEVLFGWISFCST